VKPSILPWMLIALAVAALDQATKLIVSHTIDLYETVPVIPGLVDLVYVRNRGMAFGLLNRPGENTAFYLITAGTVLALVLLIFWLRKIAGEHPKTGLALALIIGGAIGNLIDRIRLHEVIDFVDVHVKSFHWPAFNAADSAITVGTVWLVFMLLKEGPQKG
jgi:signal peptidase II